MDLCGAKNAYERFASAERRIAHRFVRSAAFMRSPALRTLVAHSQGMSELGRRFRHLG